MSDKPKPFEKAYFDALKLPAEPEWAAESEAAPRAQISARERALARAHDLRKFEIENYWKRATYFWAFQLAAFTLLGLIWQEVADGKLKPLALLAPAGLGAASALVGWMTAKGSKFWQENWEAHVDMLEGELEGRLTQVILSDTSPQFSVSTVNRNFMFLLMLGWVVTFLIVVFPDAEAALEPHARYAALLLLLGSMLFLFLNSGTRLKGWSFWKDGDDWRSHNRHPARSGARIILRGTKAGPAEKPDAPTK